MTYAEKLKHPKWQKKRLEILNRDNFKCQSCLNDEEMLHVHHRVYNSKEPWDAKNSDLITLCKSCHEWQSDFQKELNSNGVNSLLSSRFLPNDIFRLTKAINSYNGQNNHFEMMHALCWAINNEEMMNEIIVKYHDNSTF